MQLSVKEMEMLCVMHSGTVSETLAMLRNAEKPFEGMIIVNSLIDKLSGLEDGEEVYLAFDPAK